MHRKHEIGGAGIGNEKNKRIRCIGSVKLVATGIENEKNKSFRCLGSMKLVERASGIGKTRISDAWEA